MNNPTQTFVRRFEEIRTEVNRRAGDPHSHRCEIEKAAERDRIVDRNRRLLIYIRDVRNLLQHPAQKSIGDAIQVSDPFLTEVADLLSYLKKPPTANSVGVPRKKIKTASLTDRLGVVADEMKRGDFSHVPILDEHGVIVGVFNEAAVFDYLWVDTEMIIGRQMQVSEIFAHCRLDDHVESFKFVEPGTAIDDLVEMFLALEARTTRVGAAFVTASGKRSEPLQRLITAWDVLEGASSDSRSITP